MNCMICNKEIDSEFDLNELTIIRAMGVINDNLAVKKKISACKECVNKVFNNETLIKLMFPKGIKY